MAKFSGVYPASDALKAQFWRYGRMVYITWVSGLFGLLETHIDQVLTTTLAKAIRRTLNRILTCGIPMI